MNDGVTQDVPDPSARRWRKSRRSMAGGNNCVEVLIDIDGDNVHVRDSKNPKGPFLTFRIAPWAELLSAIKGTAPMKKRDHHVEPDNERQPHVRRLIIIGPTFARRRERVRARRRRAVS